MRVFTAGIFDILNRGDLSLLSQASALGELTVGIISDERVEDTTGMRPILTLEERDAQLRALPFVADVIHYTEVDRRSSYSALKPDIVVQGDEWLSSADRTDAISFLREHGIRLVLLPRIGGISTTEIRKRIACSGRRDERFLRERLQMVPTRQLKRFEAYDEAKVERLVARIQRDGVFFNPISVVRELIVIDGANRFEALRRLDARHIPCVIYDYSEIDLLGNVHFLNDGKKTRSSDFAREAGERIEFPRRTPAEIRAAAESGQLIPNGETFHRVPQNVIRLPIPLEALRPEQPFDLAGDIERRIRDGQIRFFESGVYVCDEWHEAGA